MEQNSNEQTPTVETEQAEAAAPATKRAPRRATKKAAPAETSSETDVTPVEAPAAAEEAPAEKPKRVSRARKKTTEDAVTEAPPAEVAAAPASSETPEAPAAEEAPKKPATRRRRATTKTAETDAAATDAPASEATSAEDSAVEAPTEEAPRRRTRRATATKAKTEETAAAESAAAESAAADTATAETNAADTTAAEAPTVDGAEAPKEEAPKTTTRSTRGRRTSAKQAEAAEDTSAEASTKQNESKDSSDNAGKDGGSSDSADAPAQETSSRRTRSQRNRSRQQQSDSDHGNQQDAEQTSGDDKSQGSDADNNRQQNQQDQQQSRSRTRQRDRKRRGQQNEDLIDPELTEDDVLLPIAGILDVLDNYAFVRTTGYLPGPSDVYVSLGQVKRYNLRKGDAIVGSIRKPSEHDGGGRQKYNAIVKIDSVNGTPLAEDMKRIDFNDLTPLYPQERLRLETTPEKVTQRVIDLIAPIGKGQRGLIVAPPKAGKTIVLQQIANAVAENNPEAHLMVVLVDERPEEVTDMQRTVKGEVIASTFDRPAEDHTTVAELAIERAKRLVELGHDVVVLLDSITRLGRAYNLASPASGRVLTGGVDASALYPPKRFFGAARNIENGGSLTILATALVETGSKADEVIFEEFKGTGNMELRLSRQLADRRIFPAVNLNASSTRREEMLLTPDEVKITWMLRRALGNLSEEQAAELVISKLRETQSNAEFLLLMQKSQGLS